MEDFFKIENITCGYTGMFMLENISFDLKKDSFNGIIGPNGSGKTTLFKSFTGELELKSGDIFLNDINLSQMSGKQRARKFAVVSQNIEISNIKVQDYILMGRLPYYKRFQFFESKNDLLIADKYMKMTGVFELRDKLFSELSGGEQQLVAIARALTQEPQVLLLDEPTAHLDISHQIQILNLLRRLNNTYNLTVLMIIHDLNLAGEYCDYIIMMNEGKIHTKGSPNEVLNYKQIEEVYKTPVVTRENPISKKPAIFLISERVLLNKNI